MKNLLSEAGTSRRKLPLNTPTDISVDASKEISEGLNRLLADMFALYLKYKNFHWHVSGPHFRDYHLLFDDQAEQLLKTTDPLGERVRKIGRITLRSIGDIGRLQRVKDNDANFVEPQTMLLELGEDNLLLVAKMKEVHDLCQDAGDIATASLLENWVDQAETRIWFLYEASRSSVATK